MNLLPLIRNVLLISAVVAAIFSERIDEAVEGKGLVRKVVLACSAGIVLVILIPVCMKYLW